MCELLLKYKSSPSNLLVSLILYPRINTGENCNEAKYWRLPVLEKYSAKFIIPVGSTDQTDQRTAVLLDSCARI